jgi:thioredoxin 1
MFFLILTESNFQKEVLESTAPVLVEFGAEWCGTCHILAPILEELKSEFRESIKMAKIDVDKNQTITKRFGVVELPTILFFKYGDCVDHIIGALPKVYIKEKIQHTISL